MAVNVVCLALSHGRAGAFIFAFRGGHNGLHARSQTSIEIVVVKTRRNLFINDTLAQRIGQHAFQSVTHLHKHLMILNKNKKDHAVVLVLLAHFPGARDANSVIFDGRIRLHRRENRDENLVGSLPLKIFQRAV